MANVAEQAIKRSVSHSEIVTLGTAAAPLGLDESSEVMADLSAAYEDSTCDGPNDVRAEYWGTTDDGDEWRVHVWFTAERLSHSSVSP